MHVSCSRYRIPASAGLLLVSVAACNHGDKPAAQTSGGNVIAQIARNADSGNALSVTPTEGGVAKVTPTDVKSVRYANRYELTDDNFHRFIVATDSILELRLRDPRIRDFLDRDITDAGAGITVDAMDAGRKRLESNVAVSNAISAAGLSVKDYFVASIAIAQAERFMGNPEAVPPTPVLGPNSRFLKAHRNDLDALRGRAHGVILVH